MKSMGALAFVVAVAGAFAAAQPAFARGGGHSSGGGHFGGGGHVGGGHTATFSAGSHFAPSRSFAAPITALRGPRFAPRPFVASPQFRPRFSPGFGTRVIVAAPFFAAPLFYYPPPLYYPPPVYVPPAMMAPPSQYIEQAPSPDAATPQYWYYCAESNAYYPYVKECPGGWQAVPPQPPS